MVGDPLQIHCKLPGHGDDPQVTGHGLLQGNQTQAAVFDIQHHLIQSIILIDDALGQGAIQILQGIHCSENLSFDSRSHMHQEILHGLQGLMIIRSGIHPGYTPFMINVLTEPACDVILCALIPGRGENGIRIIRFYHIAIQEK
ncbi:hypothetical protein D3C75_784440 [compost metagenome]